MPVMLTAEAILTSSLPHRIEIISRRGWSSSGAELGTGGGSRARHASRHHGLDSSHGDEVMKILVDLNERGTTIVMVTHSPAYADYANRVIHLFDGHIVTENLKEKYDRHMRPLSEIAS